MRDKRHRGSRPAALGATAAGAVVLAVLWQPALVAWHGLALRSRDAGESWAAARGLEGLGKLGRRAAEDWYVEKLHAAGAEERRSAAARLGVLRCGRAAPALLQMLRRDIENLREDPEADGAGLVKFYRSENVSSCDECLLFAVKCDAYYVEVHPAMAALRAIGEGAVPVLIRALEEEDRSEIVRLEAAHVLGELGPRARRALPALVEAASAEETFTLTVAHAALALVRLGDPGAPLAELRKRGGEESKLQALLEAEAENPETGSDAEGY
ncbi:MAG: HEAT repeat domain-containing protein [Planctomycetota bacterium]|nr:HEAT repeat domain-containing protein [Planctomycetota bacterium]